MYEKLNRLPRTARYELLAAGLISRDIHNNRLTLTEKGRILLEESKEK
jgi:predicted transcriptional regulator